MYERILVVDDEKGIADAIAYAFRREDFNVEVAYDGEEALKKIAAFKPLIVLLDINMPKVSGLEVLKRINSKKHMGVVFLTAKNDIVDRILGLEFGADDYITKPFEIREVIARVKALVRRLLVSKEDDRDIIKIRNLEAVLSQRTVKVGGQLLELPPKEFDLLMVLLRSLNRAFSREELLDLVWGMDYIGGTRTVDIHIVRIRKKLGNEQDIIQTVHSIGYKAVGEAYED